MSPAAERLRELELACASELAAARLEFEDALKRADEARALLVEREAAHHALMLQARRSLGRRVQLAADRAAIPHPRLVVLHGGRAAG